MKHTRYIGYIFTAGDWQLLNVLAYELYGNYLRGETMHHQ